MQKYIFAMCFAFACNYLPISTKHQMKRDLLQTEKNLFKELRDKLLELEKRLDSRKCDGYPKGWVGGSSYAHKGSAVNYLCMHKTPDWGKHKDGVSVYRGYVYGAEYQIYDSDTGIDKSYFDYEAPCALCRVLQSTSVIMVPGKTKCEKSWTKQYSGYLMAGKHDHDAASQYICVDEKPDKIGDSSDKNGVLLYPVESRCGSLPCGPYFEGRELMCVVCSK